MNDQDGEQGTSLFEPSERDRVRYSLIGMMRFDAIAVAQALRSGSLSSLEIECLARLIEGTGPHGIHLAIRGQGKGWKPVFDKAKAYDRLVAVGQFIDAQLADGLSVEEAVLDAASSFGVSEPTIYRDLRLYRLMPGERG